ncbi:acetyltransferase [Aerococcus sp. NPDC058936]|uniref:acetyltransferase n=1 Tax=Aerococcus sp. NPDC058936 TaxID=3346674 RepID=UPI00366F170F
MHDKLLIIGAGGHGKVCADIAMKMKKWTEISFLDMDMPKKEILGLKIIDIPENLNQYVDNYDFFISIGNNHVREHIASEIGNSNGELATLIHPSANIGIDVKIGKGTAIMAGVSVNSGTTLGVGVIINTNSSVDHDCIIKNYTHVSPGVTIAGTVNIGNNCWIGTGANLVNSINIPPYTIIGAGGVVINSIPEQGTYVGVPVNKIK